MTNSNRRSHKVKEDESPASSSRRSSRETTSGKQMKESPMKETLSDTRKSERLEKRKPSGTTPTKEKSGKTHAQITSIPTKTYDRRKRLESRSPISPATTNLKSKREEVVNGGKKRKRMSIHRNEGVSKSPGVRTEEVCGNDKESDEKSSEATVEDKYGNDDGCGDSNGEESTIEASGRQSMPSEATVGEQDRISCEPDAVTEAVEKNNDVSTTGSSICIACKKLRCYHLPLVLESILDTREVEASEDHDLQKQKQYLVKYKGHAHIHNQWIAETQLLLEAPVLVENYIKDGSMKWNKEWTMPHQLLKKRLVLSLENTVKVLNYHYEWLVQWRSLDHEQATWESENISVFDSPEGHNLIQNYDHENAKQLDSSDNDKIEEVQLKVSTFFTGCSPGMDSIHSSYVKKLHDAWTRGQNSIVFDDQERTLRIILFILSLKSVSLPFLLITRFDSLSLWEAVFSKIAPNAFKVLIENTHEKTRSKLIHVQKEGGEIALQLLLCPVNAFVKDLNVLKSIKWEAVIIDESQSSDISCHFSQIKSLSTEKILFVFCGPLGVSNLDVMSLLECDDITTTELTDISKLKETLSKLIAYECKYSSSKFVEYWVPVQISNVQLELYCSMLLSNAMALSAYSKSDTFGALHDILVSNRKCCDHPYIVDQSLQAVLNKDLEPVKFLDVGIKASGKLQFLDLILPEMRKRQLRVLIVFQPLSGSGKDSASIGDILDDFVRQRFGEDSYERVDGIGMIPSKKQVALNNFNNKEKGRFIFLLEYRACLPSVKLSSIDTIIIFDSDWNPANDLRALQRIVIDSCSEPILTFRLYTSLTLEEKILRLAEHNVTIDGKLQNISRSTSDKLLMWGATYLFKKLDEFHNDLNVSSEECWWNELVEEFLDLISYDCKNTDAGKLKITRAKPVCGSYDTNVTLQNKVDEEQPQSFWKKLLAGRDPCWKYLSKSSQRQRNIKRPQYFEVSPRKTIATNDDAGRKRKKITSNVDEPVTEAVTKTITEPVTKPVTESVTKTITEPATKPITEPVTKPITDPVTKPITSKLVIEEGEMSFPDLLKLKLTKLCEVLVLSEDVQIIVERFLKYVIENYRVNKEPESTLHAFLISLCWIGSGLLKHELDRKQSISLAKEHLGFCCKEDETNSVYLKLELAKEAFLLHSKNQRKTVVSTYPIPEVKIEISDSPPKQYDDNDGGDDDCNQKYSEVGAVNPDTSDAQEENNNNSTVQPLVTPPPGQSVPVDLVNEFNSEGSLLQANEELCLPSENQSNIHVGEQQPDSQTPVVLESSAQTPTQGLDPRGSNQLNGEESDKCNQGALRKKSCDPPQSNIHVGEQQPESQTPLGLESTAQTPIQGVDPRGSNQLNGEVSDKSNQGALQKKSSDPLQIEFERLCELRTTVSKCHDAIKLKIKSDYEKELAEIIAQINAKYEAKSQEADAEFQSKNKAIDMCCSRIVMNKVLAEAFRSKSLDQTPFHPSEIQAIQSGGTSHPSNGVTSSPSPAQPLRTQQATKVQPPLQIVNQPSELFSTTPTRASPNTNASTMPARPSPSTVNPASTPNKPPSKPPPAINAITPSTRPMTPAGRYIRPPPNIIPRAPNARNIRAPEIRAPAPHIRPFRAHDHRVMPSQHISQLPQTSPVQTPPPYLTNHNTHSIQNPPRSSPLTSSQPPSVAVAPALSFQPPLLYPWHLPATSSSHPQMSLPPMPPVSINHSGLYNQTDILSRPALDLLTDIDKRGGLHPPNTSPEFMDLAEVKGGGSDPVCLSDDD